MERNRCDAGLEALVNHLEKALIVAETLKDKNASRRQKAWGKLKLGGVALSKWFENTVRHAMFTALDMGRFVHSSIEIVRIDEISDEGALVTVDKEFF